VDASAIMGEEEREEEDREEGVDGGG